MRLIDCSGTVRKALACGKEGVSAMYTYDSFIVSEENREGFDAIAALIDGRTRQDVFLYGVPKSGKTHLLHAAQEKTGNAGMYCATTDFMLRLDLGADDAFFDRIGAVPVLFVDAFERLFEHDAAPELMRLLLAERDRLGLSTVIASRLPLSGFDLGELAEPLSGFAESELAPLGIDGMSDAVRVYESRYRTDESPSLSEDAVRAIAGGSKRVADVENAVQYLMVGTGRSGSDTLGGDDVRLLLSL